jgi:hypothetical protein
MCTEWRDNFEAFLSVIGLRPTSAHSLDRFPNTDGNYEPGNVRWATAKEQRRNQGRNVSVTWRGETMLLVEWAERLRVPYTALNTRRFKGWTIERMLAQPVRKWTKR